MASSSSEISRDFYSSMPDWQREQLVGDAAFESEFRDSMATVAGKAASTDREIVGLTRREVLADQNLGKATNSAAKGYSKILSGLNGVGVDSDLGRIYNPKAMTGVAGPGTWQHQGLADVDALRGDYESQYTDSVVDTTLAGMARAADRERLARDARSAAIGGTSNTRSSVADAVAQQLTGMNMGEMEAKLRDNAFNTAAGYGLQQAGLENDFNLAQEQARTGFNMDSANWRLNRAEAKARNELDLAGFDLEEAIAQAAQGNVAAKMALDKAELKQGLVGDRFNVRKTRTDSLAGLGETSRELAQKRADASHYGGMEAGSWLADVYGKSRTRDSAPYSFTEESETDEDSGGSGWEAALGGFVGGLSGFM